MHATALTKGTLVWTTDGLRAVDTLKGGAVVYSAFGRPSNIWSREKPEEDILMCHTETGTRLFFGASHEFVGRGYEGGAGLRPHKLSDLLSTQSGLLVPMPSRKLFLNPDTHRAGMLEKLGNHDAKLPPGAHSQLYLEVDSPQEMINFAVHAGFYGMVVRMKLSEQCIELDEGRPSCFATKLLIGTPVKSMVDSLIDKQVFRPCLPYDEFISLAERTGFFYEGYGVGDLRTIVGVLETKQRAPVWEIMSDEPKTTIELAFIRT